LENLVEADARSRRNGTTILLNASPHVHRQFRALALTWLERNLDVRSVRDLIRALCRFDSREGRLIRTLDAWLRQHQRTESAAYVVADLLQAPKTRSRYIDSARAHVASTQGKAGTPVLAELVRWDPTVDTFLRALRETRLAKGTNHGRYLFAKVAQALTFAPTRTLDALRDLALR
jgi:hypothetical protein